MPVKLNSSDKKVVLLALIVAAGALWFAIRYFGRAFPEASLNLKINRQQSRQVAKAFLAARGFKVTGYRHAARFDYDDTAKLYLERTQGLRRMNQLTAGPIHLWRWSNRWFKPLQIEEFEVDVTPAGQVVGFAHIIPDAAPGAKLDQAAARGIAEQFLANVMHRDLASLTFIAGTTTQRPARTAHVFTWKVKGLHLGDGSYRIRVDVEGDQVAGYSEYVKVPEQWARDYRKLRAKNDDAQLVDQVFYFLLILAMAWLLIRRTIDRDVPWRMAFLFGAVAAVLYFLSELNNYPLDLFHYSTTASYPSFLARFIFGAVMSAAGIGTIIFLVVAAAEPIYREGFPKLPSIRRTFSWQGLRSRKFLIANVVGLSLAIFFFAYQTLFYLLANHFGAWAPSDIPFSNQLNTSIPWAAVLFIGFFPAINEELTFRAFSIPFIRKYSRSLPVAIVGSAFLWSFLHSTYPNEPFFIRGLEVGIGGIIIGVIMVRFGIITTMIWHYSVDALYTAFLLLRSPNDYLRISGGLTAGIMLIPLTVALVAYLRSGTFAEEETLTNASVGVSRAPASAQSAPAESPLEYRPLSKKRLFLAGGTLLVFGALAFVPAYRFGQEIKIRYSSAEAIRAADASLRARGADPELYRRVAWLEEDVNAEALRYLLERQSVEQAERTYRSASNEAYWVVRYFRPLQKEDYFVYVDPESNDVIFVRHDLPENASGVSPASAAAKASAKKSASASETKKAPGKKQAQKAGSATPVAQKSFLTPEAARAIAEKSFRRWGHDPSHFVLQSTQAIKRKAREDYTFVWQAKPGDPRNVGHALYRVRIKVAGNQVVDAGEYFKLPQAWTRAREAFKMSNAVLIGVELVFVFGLVAGFIVLFVRYLRAGQIAWRRALLAGVIVGVLVSLSELNRATGILYRSYPTAISWLAWTIEVVASLVIVPVLAGALAMVLIGVAAACYPDAWRVFTGAARRAWRRDAMVATGIALATAAGVARLSTLFSDRFHAFAPVSIGFIPDSLNDSLPGAGAWISALLTAVILVAVLGIIISIFSRGWKRRAWWLWVGMMLLAVAAGSSNAHTVREYFAGWVLSAVPAIVAAIVIGVFFRDNILAYFSAAFALLVAGNAVSMLTQPAAFSRWNGLLLVALSAATLGWLFLPGSSPQAPSNRIENVTPQDTPETAAPPVQES